ncbi:hypothetical protein GUJ93_ZPchr0008g11830 [Zizania palustris]|uniref:PUM-HD domain-containing protein n=1 Tax=Zizania palustris TaxID=103762 RepID=A0A8J5RJ55_ZIZPA|nr:hypothetical protein GUJ93_ZPchr0008g11830 [Zizania palustris]
MIETAELEPQEQITSAGAGSQFLVPLLAEVHQDSSQITGLNNDHLGVGGEKIKDPAENNSIRLINIMGYVVVLSDDPFGSHFIQQKLETATTTEIVMVYKEIMPHVRILIIDVFANYAIQKDVLELGGEFVRSTFAMKFAGRIVDMSCHKYSSNVIEKCLSVGSCQDRLLIAVEILRAGEDTLLGLMMDQHGNYVIQKVLETAEMWQRDMVVAAATRHVGMLTMYVPGRNVVAQVNKLLTARGRRAMQFLSAPTSPLYSHG